MTVPRRAFLATAATLALAPRVARAADVAAVKIAGTNSESASNVFYALELGLFEKNGVHVDLQTFSNSGAYADGIVSGTFDIGAVSTGSIGLAHEHGIPFVLLANGGIYSDSSPTTYLCVARGSPIRTAADFNGRRSRFQRCATLPRSQSWDGSSTTVGITTGSTSSR